MSFLSRQAARVARAPKALALAASTLVLVAAGCDEPAGSTRLQGTATFHDGSPVPAQDLQIWLILKGEGLFTQSTACVETDTRISAGISLHAAIGPGGAFETSFDVSAMTSLVNAACPINSGTRLSAGEGLLMSASIPATTVSCAAFCQGSRPGDDQAACQAECSSGERKLFARTALGPGALLELEAAAGDSGVVTLPVVLDLVELGEPIRDTHGPDLRPDTLAAQASLSYGYEGFSPDSCALVEGCVGGPGPRRLLKFDAVIRNLGDADFILGNPATQPDLFQLSDCHGHYHLREAMSYELLHEDTLEPVMLGGASVVGHKQGFCMLDTQPVAGDGEAHYYCDFQGLSSGWADLYGSELDCQWVDITDVPPGNYTLRLTVNPGGSLPEADLSNNSALVPVVIPPEGT